jgi:hypothetical protein
MSDINSKPSDNRTANSKPSDSRTAEDHRAVWERPALKRLAANEARGGDNPGNDGKGGGSGSDVQHS